VAQAVANKANTNGSYTDMSVCKANETYILNAGSETTSGIVSMLGILEYSGGSDRHVTMLVSSPDNIGSNNPSVYLVIANNRSGPSVKYVRLSPTVAYQNSVEFGYVLHSDNSIDISIKEPSYSGHWRVQILSQWGYTSFYRRDYGTSSFIKGTPCFSATVIGDAGAGSTSRSVYVDIYGSVRPCTYGINVGSLSDDSTIIDFV
jgi:hypothetical protein